MKHNYFQRPGNKRFHRRTFFLATEGRATERDYFTIINRIVNTINIKFIEKSNKSSPKSLLTGMHNFLKKTPLENSDEAWIILDIDNNKEQILPICKWSKENDYFGCAISNPKFEYWLLLHYETGNNITETNLNDRLAKFIPNYKKNNIDKLNLKIEMVKYAVENAKLRDKPPAEFYPEKLGSSTVYRLVEKMMETS
jgi:hypothetical protein